MVANGSEPREILLPLGGLQVKIGSIHTTNLSLVVGRSALFLPVQDRRDHTLLCFKERFSENLCGR